MSESLPELLSERLRLREVRNADLEAVMSIYGDPQVVEWLPWPRFRSARTGIRALEWMHGLHASGRGMRWAVARWDDPSDTMVGSIGFDTLHRENRCAEIGGEFGRRYWSLGYALEALLRLIEHGFEDLELHRLEAWTVVGHQRVLTLLEHAGFQTEGVLRGKGFWKGKHHDLLMHARLRTDGPPPLRGRRE